MNLECVVHKSLQTLLEDETEFVLIPGLIPASVIC